MTASPNGIVDVPHSRRVHLSVPESLQVANLDTAAALPSPPPSPLASPPLPPRSPLRPRANTSSKDTRLSIYIDNIAEPLDMVLLHSRSLGSMGTLSSTDPRPGIRPKTPDKPLPILPPSPLPDMPDADDDDTIPAMPGTAGTSPPISKREHALFELLSSERAYASDLTLIREVHIPLALGQPSAFDAREPTPPSSGSSSRTVSTASDSSNGSSNNAPMSQEAARTIFSNIADIAVFADEFTELLEDALGSIIEGGTGQDRVGALFLRKIPVLEPLYNTYITRHSAALELLNTLPKTEALKEYLAHTQTLAQSLSHAWDLPSLLIKPVQRLMKYSLLLSAIIDETPADHPDKENLKLAREKIEAVTHGVNEGRRRREVVKEVLTGCSPGKKSADVKAKKKGLNIGVAASVNLGRVKSIRAASFRVKEGKEANQEAEQVARMGEDLKSCETLTRQFAEASISWIDATTALTESLRQWAITFGNVTGANAENKSAAYDAFVMVIDHGLLQICAQFKQAIQEGLLPQFARLAETTNNPERLLEAMRTLEPLHYGLLNFNVAKSRPPPQLLEASKSYVALRAQLHAELPLFLQAFNRGATAIWRKFLEWQVEFWKAYRTKWDELWDALKVDGEIEGSADETLRVWWSRFQDVEDAVAGLNIVRPIVKDLYRPRTRSRGYSLTESIETGSTMSTVMISTSAALEGWRPQSSSTSSQTLVPPSPSSMRSQQLEKKISNESVHSKKSGRFSHKHSNSSASQMPSYRVDMFSPDDPALAYAHAIHSIVSSPPQKPPYQRTASMPISLPMPLRKSNSQGRILEGSGRLSLPMTARNSPQSTPPQQYDPYHDVGYADADAARGRSSRKPSIMRRTTDSKKSSASTSRARRSPSLSVAKNYSFPSSQQPSPSASQYAVNQVRAAMANKRGLYLCRAIHPCDPPRGVSYQDIPFFTVRVDDVFEVLEERGHPSTHRNLPLCVDEGEDCLLLVRNQYNDIGWVLASFLFPMD